MAEAKPPTVPFRDYWETAATGDLMLVSGAADLDSPMAKAIKIGTGSKFSHIGLIVKITDDKSPWWAEGMYGNLRKLGTEVQFPGDDSKVPPVPPTLRGGEWGKGDPIPRNQRVYLFDSDYEEDGTVDGPVLRPLQEVIETYMSDDYHGQDGDIFIRRLTCDEAKRTEIEQRVLEFATQVKGHEFEAKSMAGPEFLQMFLSTWALNSSEDLTRLFCSECVGACYEKCGLIPDGNASNYKPQDFAAARLNALQGGSLGPETRLGLEELSYKTRVKIVSAAKLIQPAWLSVDVPDPYCICKFAGRHKFETEKLNNKTDPTWDCTKEVMWNGADHMTFEIWDANAFKWDNFLGQAAIPYEDNLTGFHGKCHLTHGDDNVGELVVEVEIVREKIGALTINGETAGASDGKKSIKHKGRAHRNHTRRQHMFKWKIKQVKDSNTPQSASK